MKYSDCCVKSQDTGDTVLQYLVVSNERSFKTPGLVCSYPLPPATCNRYDIFVHMYALHRTHSTWYTYRTITRNFVQYVDVHMFIRTDEN